LDDEMYLIGSWEPDKDWLNCSQTNW